MLRGLRDAHKAGRTDGGRNRVVLGALAQGMVTGILALSAIAVAVSAVRVSFFSTSGRAGTPQRPSFVDFWRDGLTIGVSVAGSPDAPVTVLVLTDLECPACAGFHNTVREVLTERPNDLWVVYVAHPLQYHRFALPAARAAQCASEVGAFREWVDAIYRNQDSLGLRSWGTYAREAGIVDTARIRACAVGTGPMMRIEAGLEFGARLGITGVPTVLINGWQYPEAPSKSELEGILSDLQEGKIPRDWQ